MLIIYAGFACSGIRVGFGKKSGRAEKRKEEKNLADESER